MESCHEKQKQCSRCGELFDCQGNETCWCFHISLGEGKLKELRNSYQDCLCPNCLKKFSIAGEKTL